MGEDQEKRSSRSSQRDLPIGSSHVQARTLKNKHNFYQMEVCTRLSEKKKKKKAWLLSSAELPQIWV